MQRSRPQSNITTGNIPPPVGFQIMPASGGGSSNAPSMRPSYSFLPVDQSDVNKRLAEDQDTWRKNNPDAESCRYPGLDIYGTGNHFGGRSCESEAGCTGGRVFNDKSKQCECPDGLYSNYYGACAPPEHKAGSPVCCIM
jgi:hypothetical protein